MFQAEGTESTKYWGVERSFTVFTDQQVGLVVGAEYARGTMVRNDVEEVVMGQISYSLVGYCKDFGFYSEFYGKPLRSLC